MQQSVINGSLNPVTEKHPTWFTQVGKKPSGSLPLSKSSKPKTRTQVPRTVQQLQRGVSSKKDAPSRAKTLKARPVSKSVSPPSGNKPKGKVTKKSHSKITTSNQKQLQVPKGKKQVKTRMVNTEAKQKAGSGPLKRATMKDDQDRAEMVRVKMALCSDGYTCQKFAFKPKVKKSREICLKMVEEIDTKTGKKDYRLTWSKQKKSFSIISELKSVTRGFDASPVLQRNQNKVRDFTILGKQALKLHCLSFHFRDRSLDLVFKHVETAESLQKFVNFLRDKGGL